MNTSNTISALLDLNYYQVKAGSTAVYPGVGTGSRDAIAYCALKLAGEAGEVAQKIGKGMYRGDPGLSDPIVLREAVKKELGGVLWYVAQLATEFNIDLAQVAATNLEQLADRAARGVLKGSGDDR